MDLLAGMTVAGVGAGIGVAIGWSWAYLRLGRERTEQAAALARVSARLEAAREAAEDRRELIAATETRVRDMFARMSADALRANNQSFLDLAKTALGDVQKQATTDLRHRTETIASLFKPIESSLSRVDAKLQTVEKDRSGAQARLETQLQTLATAATQLEQALRTPNVRGGWGELQLRRVVEMAGMLNRCHFAEKTAASSDDGRWIPDLIVKLPGARNVVVDAKVPYVAYREAIETSDDSQRTAKLQQHARRVREHMTQLGQKRYWEQFQPAPEFVVMFLPGEGYFSAALQYDPGLIEFGADKRVIPASPLTLIALLRAVAYGWQQQQMADNAEAVSQLGRDLYERLRRMAEHFEELGKGLHRATVAYNSAVGTLERRVLVTARRFRDLGVSTPAPLPEPPAVEQTPRALRAPELADLFGDVSPSDQTDEHGEER